MSTPAQLIRNLLLLSETTTVVALRYQAITIDGEMTSCSAVMEPEQIRREASPAQLRGILETMLKELLDGAEGAEARG